MGPLEINILGGSYTFLCTASGYPKPTIKWFKGNQPFNPNVTIIIIIVVIIIIIPITDDGNYTCVVSNEFGSIQSWKTLDVIIRYNSPPIILKGPRNTTVQVGSNVTLPCDVLSDGVVHVRWLKHIIVGSDNVSVAGAGAANSGSGSGDKMDVGLHIFNITPNDTAMYTCEAHNPLGTTSSFGFLTVIRMTNFYLFS
ncbi:hypothetical protein HELRODRAFT_75167 [Helobdella robusta]|uniref:receptor protein-tyrosine kinase n=1 Tax=Helobdella robusta TaxID=6412 RepID=T1G219_HELRO|nr:hypothetical protein HELRODRAFT_75167 [Helobdella robusta]ESO07890.1 hypothetical protein HELRODRAFT_75167 [Helobdella robusta]